MGRDKEGCTFVSIQKEGSTLSYLIPLFVFYRCRILLYPVLATVQYPLSHVRSYITVYDSRIVFIKFILYPVISFQDKDTGRFYDPFQPLTRITLQYQDSARLHPPKVVVNLLGKVPELLAAVPKCRKLGHAV